MTNWAEITVDLKTVVGVVLAAGSLIGTGYVVKARIDGYETAIQELRIEVKAGNDRVAKLDRAIVELTVELRTKGVVTYAGR